MAEGSTREEPRNATPSVASRLFVTIGLPLVLLVAGAYVSLPGVPEMVTRVSRASGSMRNTSPFALGIMPVLSAFWVVEVVAFLVPKLSRLRHHPDGRAKLDRASRVLAILLAAFQAWGVAMSLQAAVYGVEMRGADVGPVSAPLVAATLVGGVCVHLAVAELISRRGLFNGYLALFAASGVATLWDDGKKSFLASGGFYDVPVGQLALAFFSAACAIAATLVTLRGAAHVRAKTTEVVDTKGAPYRETRALALSPVLPIPSSSLQPVSTAVALGAFPATLASLDVTAGERHVAGKGEIVLLMFVVVAGLAILFSRLLHRPKELASLVEQMGAKAGESFDAEMKAARREVLLPTLLFLFALVAAHVTATFSVMLLVPLVAIGMDAIHALRTSSKIAVWEERRVAAVPFLRSVLAAEGIATETRGAATATLWQVFAPYAPVQILVDANDVAPARALLRHLVAGEPAPERASGRAPVTYGAPTVPPRRRALALAACIVAASAGWLVHVAPSRGAEIPVTQRAVLEVVRIDDTLDPLDQRDVGEGVDIRTERIPSPKGPAVETHYATVALRDGESVESGSRRLRAAIASVTLAGDRRFGIGEVTGHEGERVVALRTYILTGASAIEPGDITSAEATNDPQSNQPYVAITLTPGSAKRFEALTRAWTRRRLAIILDGRVQSAPIVLEPIPGGKLSVQVSPGSPGEQWAEAKHLARTLGGR